MKSDIFIVSFVFGRSREAPDRCSRAGLQLVGGVMRYKGDGGPYDMRKRQVSPYSRWRRGPKPSVSFCPPGQGIKLKLEKLQGMY